MKLLHVFMERLSSAVIKVFAATYWRHSVTLWERDRR